MGKAIKIHLIAWGIGICLAVLFILISNATYENPNKTKILVKAPSQMISSFQCTFDKLRWDKDYIIESTDNVDEANFVVYEGVNQPGEIIAVSPIVAVFNSDGEYIDSLTEKGYFVTSESDSSYLDFDFNKVIQEIVNGNDSDFRIYCPSEDSASWEEFCAFLFFTVNDGYYPKSDEEIAQSKEIIEKFLNSKYVIPYDNSTIYSCKGIAKNNIYFMTYADLDRVYTFSGGLACQIMYPKYVVHHSYYATHDEVGRLVYESLEKDIAMYDNIGYYYLLFSGYTSKNNPVDAEIGNGVLGKRKIYNTVTIPGTKTLYEDIDVIQTVEEANS